MPKKELDLSFLNQSSEEIELPSRGLLYIKNDFSKGKVHVRPWLTSEEKLIDKFSKGNFYNVLKRLVQNVIEEKTSVDEMTVGDFFHVLYWIRNLSYGSKYSIESICPKCGKSIKPLIDLNQFDVTYLEECSEPMEVTLPSSKIQIKFRLPRVKDLIEATEKTHSESLRLGVSVNADSYKLVRCIEEMTLNNADKDVLTQKEDFNTMLYKVWPKLPAIDSAALKDAMSKYDHGYITGGIATCPECEEPYEQAPVLTFEFFRPSSGESSENS